MYKDDMQDVIRTCNEESSKLDAIEAIREELAILRSDKFDSYLRSISKTHHKQAIIDMALSMIERHGG